MKMSKEDYSLGIHVMFHVLFSLKKTSKKGQPKNKYIIIII